MRKRSEDPSVRRVGLDCVRRCEVGFHPRQRPLVGAVRRIPLILRGRRRTASTIHQRLFVCCREEWTGVLPVSRDLTNRSRDFDGGGEGKEKNGAIRGDGWPKGIRGKRGRESNRQGRSESFVSSRVRGRGRRGGISCRGPEPSYGGTARARGMARRSEGHRFRFRVFPSRPNEKQEACQRTAQRMRIISRLWQ
jgi:hypothetical protein